MPKTYLQDATDAEIEAEVADRKLGVKAAEAKADAADSADSAARKVEAVAARIEAEEPAVSTEEATARAKEEVGDPDPFNTVKDPDKSGTGREIDVTTGKEVEKAEASPSGTAKDEAAKASAKKEA
jgi:hypothetical protein